MLLFIILIPCQAGALTFNYDHQDPAGDVLIYNATSNGTPVAGEEEFDPLDIKWINVVMDLKGKNKFINEDNTKYVYRIFNSPDNTTGFNITYTNGLAIINYFSPEGNGTTSDFTDQITFTFEKGDEKMEAEISKLEYLNNITYFGVDAYSMKVTSNATYIDYISELPGHPEYVNPEVEEGENLDDGSNDDGVKGEDKDSSTFIWMGLIAGILIVVAVIILVGIRNMRR
jgi:hypothetical protein